MQGFYKPNQDIGMLSTEQWGYPMIISSELAETILEGFLEEVIDVLNLKD